MRVGVVNPLAVNTKKKGDIGIGRAIMAFTALGWTVCVPITDSQDYDLVVDFPGDGLKRIQVKYTSQERGEGCFVFQVGIRGGTKGGIWKSHDKIVFDYIFVAASDGTDWLLSRADVRGSAIIGLRSRTHADKEFLLITKGKRSSHQTVNLAPSEEVGLAASGSNPPLPTMLP
jgi:hypothetical protein